MQQVLSPVRRRAPRRSSMSGASPGLNSNETTALRAELDTAQAQLQAALDGAAKSKAEAFKATNELIAAQRIADRESREARDTLDELRDELRWAQAERDELRREQDEDKSASSSARQLNDLRLKLAQSDKRIQELTSALEAAQAAPVQPGTDVVEAHGLLKARVAELEAMLTASTDVASIQARISELEEEQRNSRQSASNADSSQATHLQHQLQALQTQLDHASQRAATAEAEALALKQVQAQLSDAKEQLVQVQGELDANIAKQTQSKEHDVTVSHHLLRT